MEAGKCYQLTAAIATRFNHKTKLCALIFGATTTTTTATAYTDSDNCASPHCHSFTNRFCRDVIFRWNQENFQLRYKQFQMQQRYLALWKVDRCKTPCRRFLNSLPAIYGCYCVQGATMDPKMLLKKWATRIVFTLRRKPSWKTTRCIHGVNRWCYLKREYLESQYILSELYCIQ